MTATLPNGLQPMFGRGTLSHMRAFVAIAALLVAGPALAGRRASFRVGAEVVSSARVLATSSGVGVESRSARGSAAAILVEQLSGAPVRLDDGSRLPRAGQRPLVLRAAAGQKLAFAPSSGDAEVLVTLFPDGAPPQNGRW
jgi:hypothetical protein